MDKTSYIQGSRTALLFIFGIILWGITLCISTIGMMIIFAAPWIIASDRHTFIGICQFMNLLNPTEASLFGIFILIIGISLFYALRRFFP